MRLDLQEQESIPGVSSWCPPALRPDRAIRVSRTSIRPEAMKSGLPIRETPGKWEACGGIRCGSASSKGPGGRDREIPPPLVYLTPRAPNAAGRRRELRSSGKRLPSRHADNLPKGANDLLRSENEVAVPLRRSLVKVRPLTLALDQRPVDGLVKYRHDRVQRGVQADERNPKVARRLVILGKEMSRGRPRTVTRDTSVEIGEQLGRQVPRVHRLRVVEKSLTVGAVQEVPKLDGLQDQCRDDGLAKLWSGRERDR